MGQSLIERIQAKLELFRLEKRYTRRRQRRSTWVSNAVYVDGEYVYQTPSNTGSSAGSSAARIDALHGEKAVAVGAAQRNHLAATATAPATIAAAAAAESPMPDRKRLNRFCRMPGVEGSFGKDAPHDDRGRSSMIR